jgi:predicted RNA binding protein YcfA (HicA-like mRNA interferase family)
MPPLPVVSGREARRAFEKAGWTFNRPRASHMILVKAGVLVNLSVPDHRET